LHSDPGCFFFLLSPCYSNGFTFLRLATPVRLSSPGPFGLWFLVGPVFCRSRCSASWLVVPNFQSFPNSFLFLRLFSFPFDCRCVLDLRSSPLLGLLHFELFWSWVFYLIECHSGCFKFTTVAPPNFPFFSPVPSPFRFYLFFQHCPRIQCFRAFVDSRASSISLFL